ncbi:MAG: serine/threonine-protein kinase [Nannocystaceae bacterium]|nr:serine/threonine-protein kinase [Nannocystaceae bacterium]
MTGSGPAAHEPSGEDETLDATPRELPDVAAPRPLQPGAAIGDYRIRGRLGTGAMGVVYRAFDTRLQRDVALKLLAPLSPSDPEGAQRRRERLLREAQALAQVRDPHVVTVYEVGEVRDEIFVAMELVDGVDMRQWLEAQPRRRAEIVDVFIDAGRGLAAAHAAGLVHRDFKPANVLVGRDGRARVGDFGLARASVDVELPAGDGVAPLHGEITRAGDIVGTPAYMAPELLLGAAADARSDQWAFCVALWEALAGSHPFRQGDGGLDRLAAPGARGRPLPRSLRAIVLRGVAADPAARHEDLRTIVAAMQRVRARPRRMAIAAALTATAAASATLATLAREPAATAVPCAGSEPAWAAVWNDARADRIAAAFAATNAPSAATVATRAAQIVDDYGARWRSQRDEACTAARVHGYETEAMFEQRTRCLDGALRELDALLTVFATADPAMVEGALVAVHQLPPLTRCADLRALAGESPLPEDPQARAELERLDAALAHARALDRAGRYDDALRETEALVGPAAATGALRLQAEVALLRGDTADRAGRADEALAAYAAAARAAGRAEAPAAAALAISGTMWVHALLLGEPERARALEDAAEAFAAMGHDAAATGTVARTRGAIAYRRGEWLAARDHFTAAIDAFTAAFGEQHPKVAMMLMNRGAARRSAGDFDGADVDLRRAEAIARASLHPDHPDVSSVLESRAILETALGHPEAAFALQREVVAMRERELGPLHPLTMDGHVNLAAFASQLRRFDEMLAHADLALAAMAKTRADDHPAVAAALMQRGEALAELGRAAEAIAPLQRALALQADAPAVDRADTELVLGRALRELGRAEAVAHLEAARAGYLAAGKRGSLNDQVAEAALREP